MCLNIKHTRFETKNLNIIILHILFYFIAYDSSKSNHYLLIININLKLIVEAL